ncbi:hypothetical protein DFS33DRAFT_1383820 [Desarmillaria ectypa]|nr:hypothetical protein DFS33DRAFT_1383820 [Desarmillaria ectypa]
MVLAVLLYEEEIRALLQQRSYPPPDWKSERWYHSSTPAPSSQLPPPSRGVPMLRGPQLLGPPPPVHIMHGQFYSGTGWNDSPPSTQWPKNMHGTFGDMPSMHSHLDFAIL